jgi:DNA processing protein
MNEQPPIGTEQAVKTGRILTDRQKLAWLRLIRSEYVGPATFRDLLNHCGSAEAALDALPELARRGGSAKRVRICSLDDAKREIDALMAAGGRFAALGEPDYPPLLRHIDGAPPLVSIRGGTAIQSPKTVAIVGARNCSLAGHKFARRIAGELGDAGFIVVSGLARGIDSAAHEATVATGTIAVFAGGIDVLYPPENEDLAARIVAGGGTLISEMPIGWKPRARDFPRRNRLISGIANGVVLIEAAKRSGSLHTARFALEQGRDVLAVPGSPLDPRTEGCNALIRDGAALVSGIEDIVAALAPATPPATAPPLVEEDEAEADFDTPMIAANARHRLIDALGPVPVGVDELIRHIGLPASIVHIILLELEIAGRLERHPPNQISLVGQIGS